MYWHFSRSIPVLTLSLFSYKSYESIYEDFASLNERGQKIINIGKISYFDSNHVLCADGITKLCEEMGIDPAT